MITVDGVRLANTEHKPVSVTMLAPTQLRSCDFVEPMVSITKLPSRVRLGPGPLLTWFTDSVCVPLSVYLKRGQKSKWTNG